MCAVTVSQLSTQRQKDGPAEKERESFTVDVLVVPGISQPQGGNPKMHAMVAHLKEHVRTNQHVVYVDIPDMNVLDVAFVTKVDPIKDQIRKLIQRKPKPAKILIIANSGGCVNTKKAIIDLQQNEIADTDIQFDVWFLEGELLDTVQHVPWSEDKYNDVIRQGVQVMDPDELSEYEGIEAEANKNHKNPILCVLEDWEKIYRYGNYGGKEFTAGEEGDDGIEAADFDRVDPIDSLDELYKKHDKDSFISAGLFSGSGTPQTYEANKKLVEGLSKIIESGKITAYNKNKLLPYHKWCLSMLNAVGAKTIFEAKIRAYENNTPSPAASNQTSRRKSNINYYYGRTTILGLLGTTPDPQKDLEVKCNDNNALSVLYGGEEWCKVAISEKEARSLQFPQLKLSRRQHSLSLPGGHQLGNVLSIDIDIMQARDSFVAFHELFINQPKLLDVLFDITYGST